MGTWERLISKYGVTAVIALGLVLWLTGGISNNLQAVRSDLAAHVTETNFYLRGICFNTATTEAQRAACIPVGR